MSHSTEVLSDKPIILQTCHPDYNSSEIESLWADGQLQLDQMIEPVFYVIDLDAVSVPEDGVPTSGSLDFRSAEPVFTHRNIREVLPVAQNMTTVIEALGLTTVLLGESMSQYFQTLEEALAYCEEQIKA